jgi:hypothetical protein
MFENNVPKFVKGCVEIRKPLKCPMVEKLKNFLKGNKLPYKFHPGSFCTND